MQAIEENIRISTVDDEEILHFKERSQRWWGKRTALHTLNSIRVPLIQNGLYSFLIDLSKPFDNKRILDVGCGGGILSEELAKLGGFIHGIDPNPEAIAVARKHAIINSYLPNLTYSVDTIERHASNNFERYDAVVASEVLEHVTEKEVFLQCCVKCLKPGGSIFVTTINKTVRSWIMSIFLVQQVLNIIPRGTHSWDKFISPDDVTNILDKYNCKTIEVKGIDFNFVTKRWAWSTSLATNYALHAVK